MKQTAVEWLEKICNDRGYHLMSEYFEQAKEMEKQQIVKAAASAYEDMFGTDGTEYGEKYYNNIFKNK